MPATTENTTSEVMYGAVVVMIRLKLLKVKARRMEARSCARISPMCAVNESSQHDALTEAIAEITWEYWIFLTCVVSSDSRVKENRIIHLANVCRE